MLKHDKSVSILIKNLQYLATEIFKVKNDLCPEIMKEIFIFHENRTYNLRSGNHLTRRNIRTTHYGIETISNLGAKIWDLLPGETNQNQEMYPQKMPMQSLSDLYKKYRLCLILSNRFAKLCHHIVN